MEKDLLAVLEDIRKKVDKYYQGKRKNKINEMIDGLVKEYSQLEISEELGEIYESLKNKGKELLKESNIKSEKKVEYYLRYCGAAIYDFKGNLQPLNLIMKSFLITCVLFFVLAPQYFSFILPIIFILPIFLGLRGMKKRVLNGLMLGLTVVPMAILVAVVWLRNAILTMGNFNTFVMSIAQQYHFSLEFTRNLAIACIGLSVVLLASSVVFFTSAVKYRKMFI